MKSMTKKALFFMVSVLLIGMTGQKVHALESRLYMIFEGARIGGTTLDGTQTIGGVPQSNNKFVTGVTASLDGMLNPSALPPKNGVIIWTGVATINNWFHRGFILATEMDGRNRRTISTANLHNPSSPQLDLNGGRLYYVEGGGTRRGIYSVNYATGLDRQQHFDLVSHRAPDYGTIPNKRYPFSSITNYKLDLEFARHIWTDNFGKTLMWKNFNDPTIHTVSLPGGAVGVATIQGSRSLLVTTGSSLLKVAPDGSTQTLFTLQDGFLKGVVSDGLHIYLTDEQNGRLFRVNNDGTGYTLLKEYSYIRTRWGRPDKAKVVSISTGWITAAINKLTGPELAAQLAAEEAARQATILANRKAAALARQAAVARQAAILAKQQAAQLAAQKAAILAGQTIAVPGASISFRVNKKGYTRVTCYGGIRPGAPTTYKVYFFPVGSTRTSYAFCAGSTNRILSVSEKGGGGIPKGATSMMVQIVTPGKVYPARLVKVKRK